MKTVHKIILLFICLTSFIVAQDSNLLIPETTEQLIVVTTDGWDTKNAQLSVFEKDNDTWNAVKTPIYCTVGKNGVGTGRGIINIPELTGIEKKEGDGKSPAGLFELPYAIGYLPPDSVSWIALPYKQMDEYDICVDDGSSAYYNSIIDKRDHDEDYNSYEKMLLTKPYYKYGIFVAHNSDPKVENGGSCILIHLWDYEGQPTIGCTSMSEEDMTYLLKVLKPEKNPLLLQLPETVFEALKKRHNLTFIR